MESKLFMVIAGEASGDLLAAELVRAIQQSSEARAAPFPPRFFGAGGLGMTDGGVDVVVDLTQHAVIGLSDVLKKYAYFSSVFDQLLQLAREREPDVIICVDFHGFNGRFARAIKAQVRNRRGPFYNWNPKIVQFVSPQVWASRPGRARRLAREVDLLLSIFPFEKDWYAKRAPELRVEFVGHPLVDRYACVKRGGSKANSNSPLVVLLPGSRAAELRRHLPLLTATARRIHEARSEVRVKMVLPNEDLKREATVGLSDDPHIAVQVGDLPGALAGADLAITKSGTITLECALFGVPAVVFYKTSWPTYLIARRVIEVEHIAMPNLLANGAVYPEFVQDAATPDNLARAALDLLSNEPRRTEVRSQLTRIVESLGEPGACRRAAGAVMRLLDK